MNTTEQNAAKNTEAQVRRVLDVMNKGKLKQAIRITATPSQQPLPKTASKFGECRTCLWENPRRRMHPASP